MQANNLALAGARHTPPQRDAVEPGFSADIYNRKSYRKGRLASQPAASGFRAVERDTEVFYKVGNCGSNEHECIEGWMVAAGKPGQARPVASYKHGGMPVSREPEHYFS